MTKPFLVCFPVQKSFSPAPLQHPGGKWRGKEKCWSMWSGFIRSYWVSAVNPRLFNIPAAAPAAAEAPSLKHSPTIAAHFIHCPCRGARGTFAGFHRKWQGWLMRAIGYFNGNGDWEERGNHSTPNTALHSRISAWPGGESGMPPELLLDETRTDSSLPFS